ncbi:peptide chain release factor 2 [Flagellatimonas centrodinii]|uniref:peptide chain release factor 2 n=1 Tax=Flagellatimonas centrodinii TaxID=2806210 RepID=UPI001FED9895|nr:peptide chain release factor 2 [Flagellatimonas centrodinii]ULQ45628.1 peptide chain release factor 2 [Flagellatimonas centrodinii]
MEPNQIKGRITALQTRFDALRSYLDYDVKQDRLVEVNAELEDPSVWNDAKRAQDLGRERARLEAVIHPITEALRGLADADELMALAEAEGDAGAIREIAADVERFESFAEDLEFKRMFSGELDAANAYLDVQAGSGGTEAQDWAEMLLRMYSKWADGKGFTVELMERSDGEVAGIKSATIFVQGDYAFGWLRSETGVHRLVRKSPFDSGNRRHTSFSGVFVSPEVDDNVEIEINPADLDVGTFRSSGAGGQHVNKTESAIRIKHVPSGIVVACQTERSQHANRDRAMKMLKAKLYEMEMQKRNAQKQAVEDAKDDIGWGSQIRSYVLDQSRIKDLRTGVEIADTVKVLDGHLDPFIEASLKQGL